MSTREVTVAEEIQKVVKIVKVPNIAIIGRTGVGKSALINAVFGSELAKFGAGLPITKSFARYPTNPEEYSPVVLYDSPGYEATKEAEWVKNVIDFLDKKKTKGVEEQIHLVWYVINASSARVEYFERDILTEINKQYLPGIIVLSQCDRARAKEIEEIEKVLDSFNLKNYPVIQTAADPLRIKGKSIIQPFGLTELVEKSIELLPEIYLDAIIMAQTVDLKAKRELAWKYIAGAAIGCFSSSFIPIPGLNPVVAIASQTALCMKIASLYGYLDLANFLSSVGSLSVSSLTNIFLISTLDLLNTFFLPTAAISGTVAATFITVIGLTYTSVLEKLTQSRVYREGREATEEFLKKTFRQELEKYLNIKIFSPKDIEKVKETFLSETNDCELDLTSTDEEIIGDSGEDKHDIAFGEKQDLENNEIINSTTNISTPSDLTNAPQQPRFSQRLLQFLNMKY